MRKKNRSAPAFRDLNHQFSNFYRAKEYQQAFELLEREHLNFPEQKHQITYLRICMHARLNKQTEALHIFREALEQGYWLPPQWMTDSPSLISLQPMPGFQELVEICRQRLAELQGNGRPGLLVEQPAEQATELPLLIAFHGNGSNANETLQEWSKVTTHGWMLAVPQSSQMIGSDAYVWDNRDLATSEIREHLTKIASDYTIDSERLVLGGFSMGGGQAIWMALHQSVKARGFVVLGPDLSEDELKALADLLETRKPASVRGSILVGDEDHECLDVCRKVVEIMSVHGIPCELEVRPGLDHSYPDDFVEAVSKGLTFIEQV